MRWMSDKMADAKCSSLEMPASSHLVSAAASFTQDGRGRSGKMSLRPINVVPGFLTACNNRTLTDAWAGSPLLLVPPQACSHHNFACGPASRQCQQLQLGVEIAKAQVHKKSYLGWIPGQIARDAWSISRAGCCELLHNEWEAAMCEGLPRHVPCWLTVQGHLTLRFKLCTLPARHASCSPVAVRIRGSYLIPMTNRIRYKLAFQGPQIAV